MLPRFVRNAGFKVLKSDIASFLEEHEEDFLCEVRKKLNELDRRIPEEQAYLDIKMDQLGEDVAKAILEATRAFLYKG